MTRVATAGDGPELSAVTYRAEQLNMNGSVVFVGKQANISDYLGIADVFLLPSELESFGLAALEAAGLDDARIQDVAVLAGHLGEFHRAYSVRGQRVRTVQ